MEMLQSSVPSPLDYQHKRDARRARHDAIRRARRDACMTTTTIPGLRYCKNPSKCYCAKDEKASRLSSELPQSEPVAILSLSPRSFHVPRKIQAAVDDESDIHLAHSNIALPSDNDREGRRRRPSLEREDAFCDADTFKPLSSQQSEDAQIAQLYRMGLLYDEKDTESLNLNTIPHDEPVYAIRPAKHSVGRRKVRGRHGPKHLPLNLSFSDLGDDDAIARYIKASDATTPSEIAAVHEKAIENSSRNGSRSPPLRVIYELDSGRASFDVETSQPPDLIDDETMSDYDCFSDSDLQETPSQREIHDGGADTWIMLD